MRLDVCASVRWRHVRRVDVSLRPKLSDPRSVVSGRVHVLRDAEPGKLTPVTIPAQHTLIPRIRT